MTSPVHDPYQHTARFAEAFNSGEAERVLQTIAPGAIFVRAPGDPVTGDNAAQAVRDFLAMGLPMNIQDRHVYVADDTALVIADWSVSGTDTQGKQVHLAGTSTDVLRRQADGSWQSIIDNPHGTH